LEPRLWNPGPRTLFLHATEVLLQCRVLLDLRGHGLGGSCAMALHDCTTVDEGRG
jgi:hypothetical protein